MAHFKPFRKWTTVFSTSGQAAWIVGVKNCLAKAFAGQSWIWPRPRPYFLHVEKEAMMKNLYWDAPRAGEPFPSILAIGDSWFWYPFPGGSLINQLARLVDHKGHVILALGNNGAEAYDYIFGKYEKSVRTALKLHGQSLSAVFISGGGNDFAGFNDLRPLLNENCSTAQTAADCFRHGDTTESLERLLAKISDSYVALIGRVMASSRPQVKIFLHNYDYPFPTGRGVFGRAGWLKPALDEARVPEALQSECMKHVINRFTTVLEQIAERSKDKVIVVKSAGTLNDPGYWANEIHPKPEGFEKLATSAWRQLLEAHSLA